MSEKKGNFLMRKIPTRKREEWAVEEDFESGEEVVKQKVGK